MVGNSLGRFRISLALAALLVSVGIGCLHSCLVKKTDALPPRNQEELDAQVARSTTGSDESVKPARSSAENAVVDATEPSLRITVVYDNNEYDPKLKTAWGFSCLVEFGGKTILFDTGGDGGVLIENIDRLGIDLSRVDAIVLSHEHGDHVGGLGAVLRRNHDLSVYVGRSMPQAVKNRVTSAGAQLVEVGGPREIAAGISTTGELGTWIKEQSLIVSTKRGLVVITGCAHPGVVDIVKAARKQHKQPVYLVLGGFHLGSASQAVVDSIIAEFKQMGVCKAAPCHCTGDRAIVSFKRAYGEDFIRAGVGAIIEVAGASSAGNSA